MLRAVATVRLRVIDFHPCFTADFALSQMLHPLVDGATLCLNELPITPCRHRLLFLMHHFSHPDSTGLLQHLFGFYKFPQYRDR